MPQLARITATFFTSLLTRLGVRPPFEEGYMLSNVVQPVSIVDTDQAIAAIASSQTLNTPQTAGELVAPAGNTVLADTGPLPAGTYVVTFMVGSLAGANGAIDFRLQRRNAANAANIWSQAAGQSNSTSINPTLFIFTIRMRLEEQERFRIITVNNVAALETVQANIWADLA